MKNQDADINKSDDEQAQSATRTTLSEDWQRLQASYDWMTVPGMADYVNSQVSGKKLSECGHWAIYANHEYLQSLLIKRKENDSDFSGLSMLSLACGSGHIETSLLDQFKWPIKYFTGLEYDDALREKASENFSNIRSCKSNFKFFDFNAENVPDREYDVVFCCHSIHHATDLEGLLTYINGSLKSDGIFLGIDFFGPTRFQIEYDVLPIIEELFLMLPDKLRKDLRNSEITERYVPSTIKEVREADISESIRSSDLRTLLFSNFKVLDIKPMGGTLLRWLMQWRAGNYDPSIPEHVCIANLLQYIEREFIEMRRIKSDDLFFALQKTERF
jgi:SAM-dependent methyltransferase